MSFPFAQQRDASSSPVKSFFWLRATLFFVLPVKDWKQKLS
jgi:hypothetical protein